MVAVAVLLVAGVCWDRGEEPGSTVTALPRDFTPAAHPAGSGTGAAALSPSSGPDAAASPGASGARTSTAALPVHSTTPGPRTGPSRTPAPPSATPHARGPATNRPAPNGPQGPRATPAPRNGTPVAPPHNRPAAATPRPAPPKPAARAPAPAVRKPHRPAGLRPLPRSRATRLLIPYLRLDAPVMDLGLDRDRRLTAPPDDDPKLVGWYRHGASPGEQGTAVAVGHLDTDSGPAVFAGLTELERGRIVKARRADGRIAVYTVDKIKSYEKADFPSQEVYGARGRPELRLITCGGSYDRRKGYSGNVVVFAHLTGIR
ncbi:class F sortase [Streptomyces iakyrus]|uniref:class F sortase n=1 Tax=Streptomyces iakyrus TaxID=68219 RepID=UPI0036E0F2FA